MLVYDTACGPCSKFKQMVDWLDSYNHLQYISLVRADELGLLNPIPRVQRHKSFHLISPGGRISSGSMAIPDLLALLPLGGIASALIHKVPRGQSIVNFVYSTISRLHDTGSCRFETDRESSLAGIRNLAETTEVETDSTRWNRGSPKLWHDRGSAL